MSSIMVLGYKKVKSFVLLSMYLTFSTDSPIKSKVDQAVLKLATDGTMSLLKQKWFNEQQNCEDVETSELQMSNIGGVFIVLGVGISLGLVTMLFEALIRIKK